MQLPTDPAELRKLLDELDDIYTAWHRAITPERQNELARRFISKGGQQLFDIAERLLAVERERMTWRDASNYWWANYYLVQGKQPPEPNSSDKESDASCKAMIEQLTAAQARIKELESQAAKEP